VSSTHANPPTQPPPAGNVAHYRIDAEEYEYLPDPASQLGQVERRRAELLMRLAGFGRGDADGCGVGGLGADDGGAANATDGGASRAGGIGDSESGAIADLGMGGGQLVELLVRAGHRPAGFDIAWHNCARARAQRAGVVSAPLAAADLYRLPLATGSLRAAFVSEVLEHLPDPGAALREVARVVRPGGVVVASCPWREKLVWHLCVHCNRPTTPHAHLHTVHEALMRRWLTEAGFEPFAMARFNHRLSDALRWPRLTRALPHGVWRAGDRLLTLLWRRPRHFAIAARRR
jgi:2-polyprenyl-3-methyl-5-hydroxy-6-metoxy-1,4-benzoquinol methylase